MVTTTERTIDPALKAALLANKSFVYAHLIKFERPSRVDVNGKTSTSKERYTYLTDASRNIDFDDASTNLVGTSNGSQTYLANKILKIGNVAEQTQATASTYNITLDGNGLGASVTGSVVITQVGSSDLWDLAWDSSVNMVDAGFREGDKINLLGKYYNILNFREGNVLRIAKIDDSLTVGTYTTTMSLSSEEIKSILLDKSLPEYASFVNREVYIYRAYFVDGVQVGTPILLFKGIISQVSFDDDDSGIKVTWGLTSHWGDFAQVKGRITSDEFHRALDQNGLPQPDSALKAIYAYDKGFAHAETSVNLLSTYSVQVEKQDVKAKNGFFGIGAKVKVNKYLATESRTTQLDFNLQAKSIPLIYGVRSGMGLPVFADTLKSDSSQVYVIYALCEGEISSLYDVYINGKSLICNNKLDFDARSFQSINNTVEVVCRGRADRGDVLGGATSISSQVDPYYGDDYSDNYSEYGLRNNTNYTRYIKPMVTNNDQLGRGIVHGESIKLTSPIAISIDVFSGKPGQKASSQLVDIAKNKNFKIQNDYWNSAVSGEYWGPDHRLLDTAYLVCYFQIAEGETTIPELEFIINGKALECYNYDYSYSHDNKAGTESANNFKLGSYVTLHIGSNTYMVQIIDKWYFSNPDGTINTRFRFSSNPDLGYLNGIPSITKFYMTSSSGNTWTMVTYNYTEYSGAVSATASSLLNTATSNNGLVQFNFNTNSLLAVGGYLENSPSYRILDGQDNSVFDRYFYNNVISGTAGSTYVTSTFPFNVTGANAAAVASTSGTKIVSANTIVLSADASSLDNYYVGYMLRLTKYNSITDKQLVQEVEILSYNGANKVITIDNLWGTSQEPKAGDSITIYPKYADKRSSINPAIQTMDYLTSKTYGRGLDYQKDLELKSWLSSARICDTQSDVTIQYVSGDPHYSDIYRLTNSSGDIIWQGTVVDVYQGYCEFSNVIGKLTNKWNNWKSYELGEVIYTETVQYIVTVAGVKINLPTHTSGTVDGLLATTSLTLTKFIGTGSATITLVSDGNPIRSISETGARISGYNLYDSDGLDYFRLCGWSESKQRYATKHQVNIGLDTSLPLFDNTNTMLSHFGGILRYSGGKYSLDVEDTESSIAQSDSEPRNITIDHIIGKIKLNNDGVKTAYNSLTASFADPANKFEARNISFFNSDYQKVDRNVPKKGNLTIPGITNYYNTRILANKYLNQSRFALSISFNMHPRGILLLSGTVFQLQYPRYGWVNKKFRIATLTLLEDLTVDVTAEEYDDSFYALNKISKHSSNNVAADAPLTTIDSPTNLRATSIDNGDESISGVSITWVNNPIANSKNCYTELYSSYSSKLYITADTFNSNILTCNTPHNLKVGELITSLVTINGLQINASYFINSIPSANSFTLSQTKTGSTLVLTNGTGIGAILQTANLIATLAIPTNSFVDVFGGINGRVIKYYWVRYKVIQE